SDPTSLRPALQNVEPPQPPSDPVKAAAPTTPLPQASSSATLEAQTLDPSTIPLRSKRLALAAVAALALLACALYLALRTATPAADLAPHGSTTPSPASVPGATDDAKIDRPAPAPAPPATVGPHGDAGATLEKPSSTSEPATPSAKATTSAAMP